MSTPNDHVADRVDDLVHELLPAGEAGRVRLHCADCDSCRAALEQARQRLAALRALPGHEPSDRLVRATLQHIDESDARRRRFRRRSFMAMAALLAASVLLLVGFNWYYSGLKATPVDLRLLGQSELMAASPGSLRVWLRHVKPDRPLAKVPVTLHLRDIGKDRAVELVSFTTDEAGSGSPRFELPDWPAGEYELTVRAVTDEGVENATERVRLTRPAQVIVSSDKPVYQPGQTIQMRVLGLSLPARKPLSSREATFTVRDPKRNLIFKQARPTSVYGIASAECPLADELTEGEYRIACTVGDTTSERTVTVERYVLPKIRLSLKPDRPWYEPGTTMKLNLTAAYFFGKPVANAEVVVAMSEAKSSVILKTLKLRTDADGMAGVIVPVDLDRPEESEDRTLTAEATLTDTAGQKQTATATVVVSRQPFRLEVVPENSTLVTGVPNRFYVFASSPDGRPVRVKLTAPQLEDAVWTSEQGLAMLELTPPTDEGGFWSLQLRGRDAEGHSVSLETRLRCELSPQAFLLRTDRAVYRGGQTMRVETLGGTLPVFLDVLREGQTVLTTTITPREGRGVAEIDLPAEWSGSLRLSASREPTVQSPTWRTLSILVRPADQLTVKAKLDRSEYRPGTKARLTLSLTDPRGRPAPGAVSLAAIDEAVFHVRGGFPSLEQQVFSEAGQALTAQAAFARESRAGDSSPYSLASDTYPEKAWKVEQRCEQGLYSGYLWSGILVLAALLVGYVCVWRFFPTSALVVMHLIILVPVVFVASLGHLSVGEESLNSYGMRGTTEKDPVSKSHVSQSAAPDHRFGHVKHNAAANLNLGDSVALRSWFPETLLWRPEIVTDDAGRCVLDIPLADSITTWKLSAGAVTKDGTLGGTEIDIRVFQPFFVDLDLPVRLTRNDEVTLRVVVHNHLDKPQMVAVDLKKADWFTLLDGVGQRLELKPREVRSVGYRLKVRKVGSRELEVIARAGGLADRVRRPVEVVPDGVPTEVVHNGSLIKPAGVSLTLPKDAIEGSPRAIVKLYPSAFSQLVEGLDNIFQMPHGCFEQTSSSTYPNVLALDYLKRTGQARREIEAKASLYVHQGYQRLLTFESPRGGFSWYGRGPADVRLTAYGLMEFQDMARVRDVDPELIRRTRDWLLRQRRSDSGWGDARQTAYVAWAVYGDASVHAGREEVRDFLLLKKPEQVRDPYELALLCNALLALDPQGGAASPYLRRLEKLAQSAVGLTWWPVEGETLYYGRNRGGNVETTALAVLAFAESKQSPALVNAALAWLVRQKDPRGTWYSTQATVLALKALLAGTRDAGTPDRERVIEVRLAGKLVKELRISPDQADVMQQTDLSKHLRTGEQLLSMREKNGAAVGYQVTFRYHREAGELPPARGMGIELAYARKEVPVGETIPVTATVHNRGKADVRMAIVRLPRPAGFVIETEPMSALQRDGVIDRVEQEADSTVLYLRRVDTDRPLTLRYLLRATRPVKVSVPGAQVYAYYDPDNKGRSAPTRLKASEGR
jgi:uncharacterized protein YfaS (alpha-2-macroglobulin family)